MLKAHARALKIGTVLLVYSMASSGARGGDYNCSWNGPEPDWLLTRTLPEAKVSGSLYDVIELLHKNDVPISFIARSGESSDLSIEIPAPLTVQEVIDRAMDQAPGYRLEIIGRKLIIYPASEGYDTLVTIGDPHETTVVKGLFLVLRALRAEFFGFQHLDLPTLRGPSGGIYGDVIAVGGRRRVVEHLASLTAGRPSAVLVVLDEGDDKKSSSLGRVGLVKDLEVQAPSEVQVGAEFRVTPVVKLAFGSSATLIGPRCGVEYSSGDGSVVTIDPSGRAVAGGKGKTEIFVTYEGLRTYGTVRVLGDGLGEGNL